MNYRNILMPLVAFSVLPLFSCSEPVSQDSGSASKVSINGITEDGYVSGGIVWHDINNNRNLDSGEPYAITDEEGYFSRSRTGTNYCASDATDEDKRYCLKINAVSGVASTAIIRLQKGVDIISGEPFNGSISMKVSIDKDGNVSNVVATPVTAMLANMTDEQITEFAKREGMDVSDLYSDFQDFVFTNKNATSKQVKLVKAALQVHKSVELVNALLKQRYTIIGEAKVPSDASDFVYEAFTDAFMAKTGTLSSFMENVTSTEMAVIFNNAEKKLQEALTDAGKTAGTTDGFPSGDIDQSTIWVGLANRINETVSDIKKAIPTDGTVTINKDEIFARAKAVEIIKEAVKKQIETKVKFDASGNADATAEAAIAGAVGSSPITAQKNARSLVTTTNLATIKQNYANLDIAKAVESFKTVSTANAVVGSSGTAFRPDTAKMFNNNSLVGKQVSLSFGDTTAGEYGKVVVFFSKFDSETKADDKVTTGPIFACNKYDDGNADKSNIYETDGLFIGGSWKKLDDFSVQLNATVGGQPRTIIIKSVAYDTTTKLRTYSADFNGEAKEYTPKAGEDITTTTVATLPKTNADCKTLLSN